jgi:hypothetical protein
MAIDQPIPDLARLIVCGVARRHDFSRDVRPQRLNVDVHADTVTH